MKIQFDPKQQYQIDAVAAVADLFEGQPIEKPDFSVIFQTYDAELFSGQARTELGVGNSLVLQDEQLRQNVRAVQLRNDIEVSKESDPLESWPLPNPDGALDRQCPHFSVEMETGTGKTYVYLRTVFELSRRYGFKKFIVVVPSVAIREGVLKNIEITADHFRALFNNVEFEHFVYDAKKVSKLRQFAVSNTLQILVINIDAFRKNFTGTEEENKSNVIYKENDRLSGQAPIDFVRSTRPIVIIDEPQSVDSTEKSQEAIKALNPLCTLRYSATHRNPYNLVYRLDAVRAFELRLVKQIVVASASADGGKNDAYVSVEKIDNRSGIKAKLKIHVQTKEGPKLKPVTVKSGDDLFLKSDERACYREGFVITEINAEPGNEHVRFHNGRTVRLGQEIGGVRADIARVQIKQTIKRHLDKELQVRGRGLKVLTLFFIDKVANYRAWDEAGPQPGRFALAFEEAFRELIAEERYRDLDIARHPVDALHNGYFAQDKKGVLKDTRGDSQADDEVYNLIMKEKERLLDLNEPLRFIFSHSALREGWDNPNVFQICTLNETQSATKKRQEIGRGLRLPVDQNGLRVFDESINKLLVVANENYEDFARALQTEYEEECGVSFGKVPEQAFAKLTRIVEGEEQALGRAESKTIWDALIAKGMLDSAGRIQPAFDPKKKGFSLGLSAEHTEMEPVIVDTLSAYRIERHIQRERDEGKSTLRKEVLITPEFQALWERIKPRTTYRVEFDSNDLIAPCAQAICRMDPVRPLQISFTTGTLDVRRGGVAAHATSAIQETVQWRGAVPDVLGYLQEATELTRSTLRDILVKSGRLGDVFINPQEFLDAVSAIIRSEMQRLLVDGVKYEKIPDSEPDAEWEMWLFKNEELVNYLSAVQVKKSVYDYVVYDSDVERQFAEALDQREDIKLFVKLPGWFEVETPVGKYNPDWAILKQDDKTLYLVRENKSTKNFEKLRNSEAHKVRCGRRHFEALNIPFAVVVEAAEV